MKIDIITLFPELFTPFFEWSMIKKAREIKALEIEAHNLRNWGIDKRGTVDDRPYGGGAGMILRIEPIYNALRALNSKSKTLNSKQIRNPKSQRIKQKIILLSAKGKTFDQKTARKLAGMDHLILVCGHYEGVDERVRKYLIDEDISIGNYVLSGGEIPAMVVVDAVSRLLPRVLEKEGAAEIESFSPGLEEMLRRTGHRPARLNAKLGRYNLPKCEAFGGSLATDHQLIEFPQYTRPPIFKGWKVPKVLLSGNHQKIAEWRARKIKTKKS